jgi:hypothetical protein
MAQSEGSEILAPPGDEGSSPWLARARSNLQIMYRTALAVSTAVERERDLKNETEISRNRQLIWEGLKQTANNGGDLNPPNGVNNITAGWLVYIAALLAVERVRQGVPEQAQVFDQLQR